MQGQLKPKWAGETPIQEPAPACKFAQKCSVFLSNTDMSSRSAGIMPWVWVNHQKHIGFSMCEI